MSILSSDIFKIEYTSVEFVTVIRIQVNMKHSNLFVFPLNWVEKKINTRGPEGLSDGYGMLRHMIDQWRWTLAPSVSPSLRCLFRSYIEIHSRGNYAEIGRRWISGWFSGSSSSKIQTQC
ncbi:hypothetical protein MKW98_025580 [Papaver atlanticum]|uniref:Uncharacterized protein n=1 Tax=Papaver atlanticum TaxID=357466 RepID=A0AAD4SD40_9MAGN|nr:hypothetical protein MKW98_025580 [Papaver atlanticum]